MLFSYCKPGQDLSCLILRRTQIILVYGESASSVHYKQHAEVLGYLVCSKLIFFAGHFPATAVLQSLILLHSSTTFSPCLLTYQECLFFFTFSEKRVPQNHPFEISHVDHDHWRTFGISTRFILMLSMPFLSLTWLGVYPLIHVLLQTAKYWYVFVNPSSG